MNFETPFKVDPCTLVDRLRKLGIPECEEAADMLEELAARLFTAATNDLKSLAGSHPYFALLAFAVGQELDKLTQQNAKQYKAFSLLTSIIKTAEILGHNPSKQMRETFKVIEDRLRKDGEDFQ